MQYDLLGGGSFMLGFGWNGRGWVSYFFHFFVVFLLLLIVLSWLVHDSLLCLFHCSFFAFFLSGPFNYALLVDQALSEVKYHLEPNFCLMVLKCSLSIEVSEKFW